MAFEGPLSIPLTGLVAGADLSADANQFKFVKLDAAGDVVITDTQGEFAVGDLQNKPKSGEAAVVIAAGVTKMKADGDAIIDEGALLTTHDDGQADLAITGDHVLGTALTSAAATSGEIFTAAINCLAPAQLN